MNRSRGKRGAASGISRRRFAIETGLGLAGLALSRKGLPQEEPRSAVALVRSSDRSAALRTALGLFGSIDFGGKDLYIKANFNSADKFPATTHPGTLTAVAALLRGSHCGSLTLVERSGMGSTRDIWDQLGITLLARQLEIRLLALDDLSAEEWRKEELPGSSWKSGIEVPKFLDRDAYLVQISNLKTHRFGGNFSGSLKNSVGLVAKYGRLNPDYNYMKELHNSPQQGAMIAEVNLAYEPRLVIMDAMEVFTTGGPEIGEIAAPEVILASSDRVAIDAAGVGLLRMQREVPGQFLYTRPVYDHDQLKRAVELKLGAKATEIDFLTADSHAAMLAAQLESILQEVPKPK